MVAGYLQHTPGDLNRVPANILGHCAHMLELMTTNNHSQRTYERDKAAEAGFDGPVHIIRLSLIVITVSYNHNIPNQEPICAESSARCSK